MSKTKYIIRRIEQLEQRMNRRLELNSPVSKKVIWIKNILMNIHREDEKEIMKCKMRLPIEDYNHLMLKDEEERV